MTDNEMIEEIVDDVCAKTYGRKAAAVVRMAANAAFTAGQQAKEKELVEWVKNNTLGVGDSDGKNSWDMVYIDPEDLLSHLTQKEGE